MFLSYSTRKPVKIALIVFILIFAVLGFAQATELVSEAIINSANALSNSTF